MSIDLGGDGVTPNDIAAQDGDGGPNNLQNYPLVKRAFHSTATINGKLVSTPNSPFTIDLWSSPLCHQLHHGEGRVALSTIQVKTNKHGVAKFTVLVDTPFTAGSYISATATGPDHSTSEFSRCRVAE